MTNNEFSLQRQTQRKQIFPNFPDKYVNCIHIYIYLKIYRYIYRWIYVSTNTYSMNSPILNISKITTFLGINIFKSYMSIYFFFNVSY